MRERYEAEKGQEYTRLCLVNWSAYDAFCADVVADVTTINPNPPGIPPTQPLIIRRLLPEAHPRKPQAFAVATDLATAVGVPIGVDTDGFRPTQLKVDTNTPGIEGMAQVMVTYRPLPYSLATDAQVDADPEKELIRYVSRRGSLGSEATQIGGNAFKFVRTPVEIVSVPIGMESPVKILGIHQMEYTWHMVPGIPRGAMYLQADGSRSSLGRVNNRIFDRNSLFGISWPVCNVLYHGGELSDFYFTPSGTKVWDITYKISARPPMGWNFLYRRVLRRFIEVTFDGAPPGLQVNEPAVADDLRPYNSFDFLTNLFTLQV